MTNYFGNYADFLSVVGAVSLCYVILVVGRRVLSVAWRTIRRAFPVDVKRFGRWAVVTGSTDGIGKGYAFQLAKRGMDIVLISRNPEKLSAVAKEIVEQYQVSVKVITADFKNTDIYDRIQQQLTGLDIGVLVNNVGMRNRRNPGYFLEADNFEQFNRDIINVNVLSCVMITAIVLPGMLERKRGAIINLSSAAGLRPMPFMSMYSGTKAFIHFFSEALNMEYSSHGITIQAVHPSLVQTPMTVQIAKSAGRVKGLLYPSADHFAACALSTITRESSTAGYWPHELETYMMINQLSDFLLQKIMLQNRNVTADMLKAE